MLPEGSCGFPQNASFLTAQSAYLKIFWEDELNCYTGIHIGSQKLRQAAALGEQACDN